MQKRRPLSPRFVVVTFEGVKLDSERIGDGSGEMERSPAFKQRPLLRGA